MFYFDGAPPAELFLNRIRSGMLEHGVMIMHIGCRHPLHGHSYTVGLTAHDHPELIMVGLDSTIRHYLLNTLAREVIAGRRFRAGDTASAPHMGGYELTIVGPVDADSDKRYPVKVARDIFPDTGPPYQVVFPDDNCRRPWEDGYDMEVIQPLLGPVPA